MYRQEKSLPLMSTASAIPNNLAVRKASTAGLAEQIAVIHPGYVSIIPVDNEVHKTQYVAVRGCRGDANLAHVSQVMWCALGKEVWFVIASSLGLQVFDAKAETCFYYHPCQDGPNVGVADSPQLATVGSELLCVGNSAGCIYLFRILDQQCEAILVDRVDHEKAHKHSISAIAGTNDDSGEKKLASGDQEGKVIVWFVDRDKLHKDATFPSYNGFACTSLQIWQKCIIVSYGSGHIRIFSTQPTAAMLAEVVAHARWITAIDVAPETGRLLSVGEDSLVRVWQINQKQPVIEHYFSSPLKNSLLVGARFLSTTGSAFCVSNYDSSEVHRFQIS